MTSAATSVEPLGSVVRRDRAAERADALETLWRESTLDRVKACGRRPLTGGRVSVRAAGKAGAGRSAGFGGLQHCGSTWACPECSAKIAATRKAELQEALTAARRLGWTVSHVVLTMRHTKGQGLDDLWAAVSYAWHAATSGRAYKGETVDFDVRGWVRLVEVTHGKYGWHVHVHALVFTGPQARTGYGDPADLGALLFQRWSAALQRKGMRAPLATYGGLDVKVLRGELDALGEYFAKNVYRAPSDADLSAVAVEVARGDLKDARHGNRTPFAILGDVVTRGLVEDLALWHEWEAGSRGRRQMTWARGLREQLVTEVEVSDQEAADEDLGGADLLLLEAPVWREVCAIRGERTRLRALAVADDDGTALRVYLRARDWPWIEPMPPAPAGAEPVTRTGARQGL